MADQVHLFGAPGRTDDAATLADLEVDYTPTGVALQMMLAISSIFGFRWRSLGRPILVLCPAAGSGAWVRAVRALFPDAHITAVEPRASERENLEAAADVVVTGSFPDDVPPGPYDLVVDNIPFSGFADRWHVVCRERGFVEEGLGVVAFYGLTSWGQGAKSIAALQEWTPEVQIRAGGRIAHRGDGATDGREVSVWVWHLPCTALVWVVHQLLELPTELRRWDPSAVPGTYAIEPALVERVRGFL